MRPHRALPLLLALLCAAPAAAAPPLLPFPNDRLTVRDRSRDTGRRLDLAPARMPRNAEGVPLDPRDINRFDGFSPGSAILVKVRGLDTPAALRRTNPVGLDDLGAYRDRRAPVVVTDTESHRRWPIWVELDANATTAKGRLLLIHPARNFLEGHTYRVTLRRLKDGRGRRLKAPRPWRFTVASEDSLSRRMLAIRDDAFAQLGDRDLADGRVAGRAPAFEVTSVTEYAPEENPRLARQISGTFDVPCYLDEPGCPPGAKFNIEPARELPAQLPGNVMRAPFVCNVPRSASAQAPARLSLYGHGLLGKHTEINAGNVQDMAFEHDMVFCATKWAGMSDEDIPNALTVLRDGSRMPTIADRLQQGILNTLYLGRLMIHPDGLPADAALAGIVDATNLYYDGNSQGGIMGGATTPFAPDFTRAVLGVPGMNYSVLLNRSKDWDGYSAIFDPAYPNERDRPLVLDLLQLMWDRGEADGYAQHLTDDPLPGTPRHTVLLHPAIGDQQVTTFQAEVMARTVGLSVLAPAADAGRLPAARPWGIPAIGTLPFGGSAIVFWDSGPGNNGPAPLENLAPREGQDPHEHPRATRAAREQKSAFLMPGGAVIDVCGGAPCHTDAYRP